MVIFVSNDESKGQANISVRKPTHAKFAQYCTDKSLVQKDAVSVILEWFMSQPPEFQAIVFRHIPPSHDHIELLLRRMAGEEISAVELPPKEAGRPTMRHAR